MLLVAVFWSLNWSLSGMRTHWGFFGLWLGYCLMVDAWVWLRSGSSLWTRSRWRYVGLFLASVPIWWLFELINRRTDNWTYLGRDMVSDIEYVLLASLSFSTVVPAVFGTAELASTFGWIRRLESTRRLSATRPVCWAFVTSGFLMAVLLLGWPGFFFPFVWVAVFLILDPLNYLAGRRSLLRYLSLGQWRPILALGIGCFICGFFWEMWNYWSYPKWTYQIPFLDHLRIFEMPALGYAGYFPFSMELFALYHWIAGRRDKDEYVQLGEP